MKHSLITFAVLAALSGAAAAQSNVTIYGLLDQGIIKSNGGTATNPGSTGTSEAWTLGQASTSRLGFRGTEDLGGGLAASFWLEGAINPDTGTTGLASINGGVNNASGLFQRRSTVSLAGGFGELRLGRDFTSTFWNLGVFDPFGTVGVGNAGNIVIAPPTFNVSVPAGGSYGTLVRDSNMVAYFLPSGIAGGLYGQVQVAAGENSFGQKYFGGRLGYATGPFNGAVAYGKTQATSDIDGDQWNLGASWNFGMVMLSGYYGNISIGDLSQDNWFIGATAPIGLWTLKASYGEVSRSGAQGPVNIDGQKASMFAIGAVYDLSKRTALYSNWSGISNKGGARFVVAPLLNAGPFAGSAPNGNSQGFEIGVKHSF